jgi:pimeloyl-ACP methyl ester carboxylesterase
MDRRGRGASGDAPDYSIEREFEDVAAVLDQIASRTDQPAAVWGHSFGADAAMGAATLIDNVNRLILYEPGLGITYPAGSVEAVEAALAAGDQEAAAIALLEKVVELSDEEIEFTRSLPTWPARLALLPTLPREAAAESGWVYEPGRFDRITAPALVLAGSDSPPAQQEASRAAAAAIPGARLQILEGHSHIAHRTDTAMVAGIIREFIAS